MALFGGQYVDRDQGGGEAAPAPLRATSVGRSGWQPNQRSERQSSFHRAQCRLGEPSPCRAWKALSRAAYAVRAVGEVSTAAPLTARAAANHQYPARARRGYIQPKTPAPLTETLSLVSFGQQQTTLPKVSHGHDGGAGRTHVRRSGNIHGHRRDEDRKVQCKGADQKQHDQDRPEVRSTPHVAKPFQKSRGSAMRSDACTQFRETQERHREQHCANESPLRRKPSRCQPLQSANRQRRDQSSGQQ